MRYDKVIQLYDEDMPEAKRAVCGRELKVGITEHYAAAATDQRPELKVEIYAREYHNENRMMYKGIPYRILRTAGEGEKLQLVGERSRADV